MFVNKENVVDCWNYYEEYYNKFYKLHYKSVTCEDFINWCEDNLIKCPNCGEIILKENIDIKCSNCDEVCEECINNGYYE